MPKLGLTLGKLSQQRDRALCLGLSPCRSFAAAPGLGHHRRARFGRRRNGCIRALCGHPELPGFGVDLAAAEARTPTPEGTPGAAELYDVFCRIDSDGDKRVTGLEVATAIQEGTLLEWVRRLFRLLACTAQC